MVKKVVLVNANGYSIYPFDSYTYASEGSRNLGLKIIQKALENEGFDNVSLCPSKPTIVSEYESIEDLKGEVRAAAAGEKDVLFGVSTNTQDYPKFQIICDIIGQEFPDSLIVGGGSHFKIEELVTEDSTHYRNPIEVALLGTSQKTWKKLDKKRLVHGVVVGHAQPLVDLVIKHNGNLEQVMTKGFYKLDDQDRVVGHDIGRFPRVRRIPYLYRGGEVGMIFRDSCANRCRFCPITGGMNPSIELSKASLMDAIEETNATEFAMWCSNPFPNGVPRFYQELFTELDSSRIVYKSTYVEPSALAANFEELMAYFRNHYFTTFQIGRDVVTYKNAKIIGARLKGQVKSAKQIREDGEAIKKFIGELGKSREPGSPQKVIEVNYIMTPYETKESALQMVNEAERFYQMSNKNVVVVIQIFGLAPYPGTEVKKQLLEHVLHPEGYLVHASSANDWSYDLGPGTYLLDVLAPLINGYNAKFPKKLSILRRAIEDIYSGSLIKVKKEEPEHYLMALRVNQRRLLERWTR